MINAYIDSKIHSSELGNLLKIFIKSKNLNEQLYGHCLLIELKFGLTSENILNDLINELKRNSLTINCENFILRRNTEFSNKFNDSKPQLARVVDKSTFVGYVGSFKFNKKPTIDKIKISLNGWSTRNGIVWVTPKDEIDTVWHKCKNNSSPADDICDHLGFPRDRNQEYIKIIYDKIFPEPLYQPNSSNRLWHYEYNLYISHNNKDSFGRTYNQNSVPFARELVHKKSYFYTDKFQAIPLGRSSVKLPINNNIISEALSRFNS